MPPLPEWLVIWILSTFAALLTIMVPFLAVLSFIIVRDMLRKP